MYKQIIFEESGAIATITLNRPESFNALSDDMRNDLRHAARYLMDSQTIQIVIVTGAGKAFCAGGDIELMKKRIEEHQSYDERLMTYRRDVIEMVHTLNSIPQIMIAKLNGHTFGAGCSLAMLCDIRIAHDKVKFGFPFVKRGLIPDWGASYLLPRIVGYPQALELSLTGQTFDAKKAKEIGFIQHTVAPEAFDQFVADYTAQLLENSPYAMKKSKQILQENLSLSIASAMENEAVGQSNCYLTEDHVEGVLSFIEKRPAKFVGK